MALGGSSLPESYARHVPGWRGLVACPAGKRTLDEAPAVLVGQTVNERAEAGVRVRWR